MESLAVLYDEFACSSRGIVIKSSRVNSMKLVKLKLFPDLCDSMLADVTTFVSVWSTTR